MPDAPNKIARFGLHRYEGKVVAYIFKCPGCGHPHQIYTADSQCSVKWDTQYDANKDSLIVSPSLLVWHGEKEGRKLEVCHSFIKGTQIEFLSDCSNHALHGLVDIPLYDWGTYGGLDG